MKHSTDSASSLISFIFDFSADFFLRIPFFIISNAIPTAMTQAIEYIIVIVIFTTNSHLLSPKLINVLLIESLAKFTKIKFADMSETNIITT